jgi:hypothetical protein
LLGKGAKLAIAVVEGDMRDVEQQRQDVRVQSVGDDDTALGENRKAPLQPQMGEHLVAAQAPALLARGEEGIDLHPHPHQPARGRALKQPVGADRARRGGGVVAHLLMIRRSKARISAFAGQR